MKVDSHRCAYCDREFAPKDKRQRYCSRDCVNKYGRDRLAELRAQGRDPSHGGKAAQARRDSLARRRAAGELLGRAAAKAKREGRPAKPAAPDPPTPQEEFDEEEAWAERGSYWEGAADEPPVPTLPGKRRRALRKPLVLNGHGVSLRVHQGALVVRNGFTHYPQERQELRLFPGDRKLPSRIVVLDGDGSVSLDVIGWLSRQRVPLVMLNWQGEVVSTVGDGAAVYDPALREAQLAAKTNGVGMRVATQPIRDKITQSQATLRALRKMPGQEVALYKLEAVLEELQTLPTSAEELQLIEARGALAYFSCWQSLPLRWKGTGRKTIPPEWERVGLRQSLFSSNNRHATHPMNAMLNYTYGVLESQVRIAALTQGLDTTISYLHACRPGRVALVYDLMEPLRPQVDRLVLDFVRSHTFSPSDFVLTAHGVCKLHPQLARQVSRLTVSDSQVQETILCATDELKMVCPLQLCKDL